MKTSFTIILLLFYISNYSQHKKYIYLDENCKEINFLKFDKQLESKLFNTAFIINDSVIFKKLEYKEFFGRIDNKRKYQLNKLFHKRYRVDSTNIWYIHYSIDKFGRNNKKKLKYTFKDSLVNGSKQKKYFTRKTNGYIQTNNPDTIKEFFKIINKFELSKVKNPVKTTLLHFDDIKRNQSTIIQGMHNHFYEDYNLIIKNTFNVKHNMYNLIIIHPDGSYYISKNRPGFNRKELFKFNSFKREEKKWRRKHKRYN